MPKKPNGRRKLARAAMQRTTPAPTTPSVRLRSLGRGPIKVQHLESPPKILAPKRIHPRHLLPLVREGQERGVHSTTRDLAFLRALSKMAAPSPADEIALAVDTELTGPTIQQTASNVGEPSVAMNGNVIFFTGNWYAAVSSDGGKTFQYIDPATSFPNPAPNSQFCCDQVVHYLSQIDTFVWLLQYGPESGDNIQRLAIAKTADVAQGRWRLFDITTQSLNVPGAFLDFPDLAAGATCLYVTTNIFAPGDKVGSAVVRIPFSGIQSGNVTAQPFVSMDLQSFRVAQNYGTTAFFAAHQDTSTLAVFSWPEGQSTPVSKMVGVARWLGGNGYQSRTPDGRRWLDRADSRITGATATKNDLWFAWSVNLGSNQRPNPFVQIARIKTADLTLVENINLFDADSATCYAALSTNANDEVGVSYMLGGGSRFPSHVVGILTGILKDLVVSAGDRGPLDPDSGKGEWGDYLTVRRAHPDQKLFAATGYTMKGPGDGSNRDTTPRFVVFGRVRDVGPQAPPGPDQPGLGNGTSGQPFHDVNALPTVSGEVAAVIKAAAMAEGLRMMPLEAAPVPLRLVTKPGVERWPVKTGTDADVALVGKNVVNGQNLGTGIVDTTVEELIRIPRPPGMRPPTELFAQFQDHRASPVETTVWRVDADIIALKQEADGDYHLVLQGVSGQTMIAEIPTPQTRFVGTTPWLANMTVARKAVDDKLVSPLSPAAFVPIDGILVPRESLPPSVQALAMAPPPGLPASFRTPDETQDTPVPMFQTKITPTHARITGVGFFDKVHAQTGVSLLAGIELHPILKVEWL